MADIALGWRGVGELFEAMRLAVRARRILQSSAFRKDLERRASMQRARDSSRLRQRSPTAADVITFFLKRDGRKRVPVKLPRRLNVEVIFKSGDFLNSNTRRLHLTLQQLQMTTVNVSPPAGASNGRQWCAQRCCNRRR